MSFFFKPAKSEPVTTGLLRWYKLNAGSGSTATDFADSYADATAQDATINGATWTSTAKTGGQALDHDAVDDYVDLPSLSQLSAYTLSAWVQFRNLNDGNNKHIFDLQANHRVATYTDGNGNVFLFHKDGTGTNHSIQASVPDTDWHLWTATWDGSTLKLYRDASEMASESASGVTDQNNSDYIGGSNDGSGGVNQLLDGIIDDARVYNEAKTQQEIQTIKDNTI